MHDPNPASLPSLRTSVSLPGLFHDAASDTEVIIRGCWIVELSHRRIVAEPERILRENLRISAGRFHR